MRTKLIILALILGSITAVIGTLTLNHQQFLDRYYFAYNRPDNGGTPFFWAFATAAIIAWIAVWLVEDKK